MNVIPGFETGGGCLLAICRNGYDGHKLKKAAIRPSVKQMSAVVV